MSKESRRYGYNPDVFEVGRKQAARMLYPHFCAATGNLMRFFEPYIVVSADAWFGISEDLLHVYCASCCETLESAHDFVELAHSADDLNVFSGEDGICSDYEIWHLMDDDELWDEWESRVADSRLDGFTCEAQRQFVAAEGFTAAQFPFLKCSVHDVDWGRLPDSGTIYELTTFSGVLIQIFRFSSLVNFEMFTDGMRCTLSTMPHYAMRYRYDVGGIVDYESVCATGSPLDFSEV